MLIHQISGYNVTYKTVIELIENSLRIEITSTVIMIPTDYTATGTPPSTQSLSVNNGHVDLLADNDQHAPPQINDTNPHSIEGDSVELSSLTLLSL